MKQLFPPSLLAVMLVSCTVSQEDTSQRNVELARAAYQAFNEHDWVGQASYFSDTCKYLDPSLGKEYVTMDRQAKAVKYEKLQQRSPDIRDSITSIFGVGDKVVVQFTSSGTAMIDSAEVKWSLPICSIFTFKNGKIVVDETYYDRGR